jgi:hypothetical protein
MFSKTTVKYVFSMHIYIYLGPGEFKNLMEGVVDCMNFWWMGSPRFGP